MLLPLLLFPFFTISFADFADIFKVDDTCSDDRLGQYYLRTSAVVRNCIEQVGVLRRATPSENAD